jgi:4-carboxymuconolactone decarboxylase
MSRLQDVKRDDLSDEGKEVWDTIAAVRSGVSGPYGVVIRVPELARQVVNSEDYFRFKSTLTAAERELVTLATAREAGARFAWAVHERAGMRDGIDAQTIDAVRRQGPLDSLTPRDRILVEVTRSLCRDHTLPADLYGRALAELGERTLIETVALVGHYSTIGLLLNTFDVAAPAGTPSF